MKSRIVLAVPATVLFLMTSFVDAQTPAEPETGGTRTVNLTMEQRHIIKEFVSDLKVEKAPAGVKVSVGEQVSDNVRLQALPAEVGQKVPQVRSHMLFVSQDRVVLVDPSNKKISEVIE